MATALSKRNDLIFTFCIITEETILEKGRVEARKMIKDKLEDLEKSKRFGNKCYIRIETDPIKSFLCDRDLVVPLYIHGDKLNMNDVRLYNEFINNIENIEFYTKEILLSYYSKHENDIRNYLDRRYSRAYSNILKNTSSLDEINNIANLAYLVIEDEYMSIGLSVRWSKCFLEVPIFDKGEWVSFNDETHFTVSITKENATDIVSVAEVATFRDLQMRPDMGLIVTHGTVRSFLGKKSISFPIWLMNTYEINELQEERFQEFQRKYSYYSKLVADSLIKYYKINHSNIMRDFNGNESVNIDRKGIMDKCTLSKLEISNDGSMYVVINSNWGEEISIQLWNKNVQLNNYYALPIIGSKYGRIN